MLSSRLTPLFDGRPGIRGTIHVQISQPEEVQNAKSKTKNSPLSERRGAAPGPAPSGQIQNPKSPIQDPDIQNAASPSGSEQPSTCLYQRIQFATGVNPMARIAYGLYRGKFLNAVSVGFVPIRWQDGDGKEY